MVTVTSGLSRAYFFRSSGDAWSVTMDFICAVSIRPTSPSTDEKSARAAIGFVIFQSLPSLANWIGLAETLTSRPSTLSRAILISALSRRLNVDLLSDESWKSGMRKTRFSSFLLAYRLAPVGVLLPTRTRPDGLPAPDLNSTSMRGVSRPYSFRSVGLSSMTLTISIWPRALVRPMISDSAAGAEMGATICQVPDVFLSDVTSPDSDLTFSSSILSGSTTANTFSFFGPVSAPDFFDVTKYT